MDAREESGSRQELFERLLKEVAGQLWQSHLQDTLQEEKVKACTGAENLGERIRNYEDLFDVLVQNGAISPTDISLLSTILDKHDLGHFIWPLYEAGFGQTGLRRNSSSAKNQAPVANETRLQSRSRPHCSLCTRRERRRSPALSEKLEFKELLRDIGRRISEDDLSALLFLCQDAISRCQMEQIATGMELFTALRKRHCITARRPEFLYRILQDCGRLDLSHLVDCYVYLHLNQREQKEVDSLDHQLHVEEGVNYEGGRNYKFRRSLKQLGDKLGHSDLQSMKVIAGSFIPDSKLEKVKTVFDLFILLEERGRLSPDDISFLEELLDDKVHLVHHLYQMGFGQRSKKYLEKVSSREDLQRMLPIYSMFSPEQVALSFRRLLRTVGSRLTTHDINELKFLCPDEISLGCSEEIESGLDLLVMLEKRQVISAGDVTFLQDSLEHIGRKDLCTFLTIYKKTTASSHYSALQSSHEGWSCGAEGMYVEVIVLV